jgi:hypothetical protein
VDVSPCTSFEHKHSHFAPSFSVEWYGEVLDPSDCHIIE